MNECRVLLCGECELASTSLQLPSTTVVSYDVSSPRPYVQVFTQTSIMQRLCTFAVECFHIIV